MTTPALAAYFENEHGVGLGETTLAKLSAIALTPADITGAVAEVRGRDVQTGGAKTVRVTLAEVARLLS